ncbi:pseudouridine synthase, RluA family [Candidatus Magnetomorum sp. HK-1]|nr:pseudouridine synthase, RluA family [Candidatus Magnetomorum sp. HK-1]
MQTHIIDVTEQNEKKRLDIVITRLFPQYTRSNITRLIKTGCIQVNSLSKKASYLVRNGDRINIIVPECQQIEALPESIPLHVLYEDQDILVINKQANLVIHPAPGHPGGTLVNALLHYNDQHFSKVDRFGIVHRLDQDTTGCLVIAKNRQSQNYLNTAFKERTIKKRYQCVVHGQMNTQKGQIDLPIGRHPVNRKKMSTIGKHTRSAETHWKVSYQFQYFTLLDILLKTGRTHQIRVHCAAIHHPIVGDPLYGHQKNWRHYNPDVHAYLKKISRQMLHAYQLGFVHPTTQKYIQFEAPLPQDMAGFLEWGQKS